MNVSKRDGSGHRSRPLAAPPAKQRRAVTDVSITPPPSSSPEGKRTFAIRELALLPQEPQCHAAAMTHPLGATERTRVRRGPKRAVEDRSALYALLDDCAVVHVAIDGPRIVPMAFGRAGDRLFLHGHAKHGLLRATENQPTEVAIAATATDGLVLAKSAFHHSMNYRSAVIYGQLERLHADAAAVALDAIVNHTLPGRAAECRSPRADELAATFVAAVDLAEASVKVRSGPPIDTEADQRLPHWAGVLPIGSAVAFEGPDDPTPSVCSAVLRTAPRLDGTHPHGDFIVCGEPAKLDLPRVLGWLRDDSYWATDLTLGRLLRSVQQSYVAGAWGADGQQYGFARVVTDSETFAWLADVYVDRAVRGRGLGKAVVDWLVHHPRFARMRRWMLGTQDAHELYTRVGFAPAPSDRFMLRLEP